MTNTRQLFLSYLAQTSPSPLMIDVSHAEGVYFYDQNQKAYLDLIAGISVSNVGHRHPKVIAAIEAQLQKYLHIMVYGEMVQSPQVQLAEALVKTLPSYIDNVYFTNSGSEAIEGALKLAKRFTERTEIISCQNAYHGSSHGALSAGGNEYFKQAFRPLLPHFRHIRFGVEEDLSYITEKTAAVLIETVQGEAGIRVAQSTYFEALSQRCKETGTLLIVDEIQAGFGRTGKFWAFEHYALQPDIVVAAKGMGGGMPIGAFMASKKLMQTLTHNPILGHITTFGGHPLSAAASLATLQTIQEEQLAQQAEEKAQLFIQYLQHKAIRQIRHKGLMMAVEVDSFAQIQTIIQHCLSNGLLTDWFLFCDNSLRIAPPLIITPPQIEQACHILLEALDFSTKF